MLPENSVVFFVNADGVGDGEIAAAAVAQMGIEIFDVTDTVAPELEAVGTHTHSIFADVKCIFADLRRARISIGNDHLGERGTVKNGPRSSMVGVTHVMEGESLARIKADHERPVLPADSRALQRKAWPFRLCDVQRLDIRSLIGHTVG